MKDAEAVLDQLGLELARALETAQVFAVVDAAHFEYLQDTLTLERFRFDPLYLDEVDNPTVASGPHLVHVTGPSQIAKLRGIIGDKPACVWWIWPDEPNAGAALYRHLRGLSMVELPGDRFDVPEDARSNRPDAVLFRHADADVMAMILPLLDDQQVSRVFGAASGILIQSLDVCGVRLFERAASLPPASRGLLRIRDDAQYFAIAEAQTDALRNRAVREFAPRLEGSPKEAAPRIQDAFDRADSYALDSQELIWEFIEIDIAEGAGFENSPQNGELKTVLKTNDMSGPKKLAAIREALRQSAPDKIA